MSVSDEIETLLSGTLSPTRLEVLDESHKHAGHSGWRPGGETHFRVRLVTDAFEGLTRVQRHRLVHDALKDLLANRVHALALDLKTPAESAGATEQGKKETQP